MRTRWPLALAVLIVACAPAHHGYWVSYRDVTSCERCVEVEMLHFRGDTVSHLDRGLHCSGAVNQLRVLNLTHHLYRLTGSQLLIGRDLSNAGTLVLSDDGTMRISGISAGFDGVFRRPTPAESEGVRALFDLRCHDYWGECFGAEYSEFEIPDCTSDADCPLSGMCDPDSGYCEYPDC